MTRDGLMRHEFVEFIPATLEHGVLYVSIPYATTVHLCACGCGHKVIAPLTPTDWELIYNGETVSLNPSIGNWSFDCRSHYWIKRDRIQWSVGWSQEQVSRGRAQDRKAKAAYLDRVDASHDPSPAPEHPPIWWRRISRWLRRSR